MNITPVIKLATVYMAFSISAYAVEVFTVTTSPTFPTQNSATFLGSDYDTYGTTDSGNGSGWGSGITANFNGVTPWTTEVNGITRNWISVVNPGDQFTSSGGNASTTTYYGPTFYTGLNRDQYKGSAGVIHSSGNGYRIRVNNITATDIENNGGNDINFKALFLFDADLSVLGENENLKFSATDTIDASFTVPRNTGLGTTTSVSSISVVSGGTFDGSGEVSIEFSDPDMEGGAAPTATVLMNSENTAVESVTLDTAGTGYTSAPTATFAGGGVSIQPSTNVTLVTASQGVTNGRASSATYRPMIKAGDEYYAGPVYAADLSAIESAGVNSSVYSVSQVAGGDTVWTLMPSMERTNNALQTHSSHPKNLTVISDGTETLVTGSQIKNITQVGFMLETNATINTGGYNLGVRQFSANATPATPGSDADGDGVVDAEDVHPGFNDSALTTYLNDNNYIVDEGSGGGDGSGGLSEQDIIDLRAGSTLIDASTGSAAITIQLEQSTDITDPSAWTDMGSEGQATVTVPMSGDTTFFRVRAQ